MLIKKAQVGGIMVSHIEVWLLAYRNYKNVEKICK